MRLYRDFTSQEEIDREYNIGEMLPQIPSYIELFVTESDRARQELPCSLDVRFGPTLDETVDVFPSNKANSPVIVFIHGGYWRAHSSKEFSLVARGLTAHGITVVVSNYSLCPKVTIAEITRQSRAVIAWLHREAASYNADPNRIFVCGHSAGAQQGAMLATTDWRGEYDLPDNTIKGGILISGIYDLRPLRYSWIQPTLLLTHEIIMQQSPCFNIPVSGPPLLVTFGGQEPAEFHRQSETYFDGWQTQQLPGELLVQTDKDHFSILEGLLYADDPFCRTIIDFMKRCEDK